LASSASVPFTASGAANGIVDVARNNSETELLAIRAAIERKHPPDREEIHGRRFSGLDQKKKPIRWRGREMISGAPYHRLVSYAATTGALRFSGYAWAGRRRVPSWLNWGDQMFAFQTTSLISEG